MILNPGGITPRMVVGWPLSRTARPAMCGSAPYRRRHSPSLMMATKGEPMDLRKRQLFEQHGMNDGEDGGICADAEGQSGHRDESESRTLEEHAQGQANILATAVDPRQAAPIAVQFFGLFNAAEFAP